MSEPTPPVQAAATLLACTIFVCTIVLILVGTVVACEHLLHSV